MHHVRAVINDDGRPSRLNNVVKELRVILRTDFDSDSGRFKLLAAWIMVDPDYLRFRKVLTPRPKRPTIENTDFQQDKLFISVPLKEWFIR